MVLILSFAFLSVIIALALQSIKLLVTTVFHVLTVFIDDFELNVLSFFSFVLNTLFCFLISLIIPDFVLIMTNSGQKSGWGL